MSGPRRYGQPTGSRRMIAIAAVGIIVVIGLFSLRYLGHGPSRSVPLAKIETPSEIAGALQDMQSSQQQIIDELQMTRDRVARQQAEINKLMLDLQDVTQKMDTLRNGFAREPEPQPGRR